MQWTIEKQIFELQAEFCKGLSDPKRLMILHELTTGEKSVGELSETLGLKQSNTSQHVGVLRKAGIIVPRRDGNTVYYRLVSSSIADACDLVRQVIASQLERGQLLARDILTV